MGMTRGAAVAGLLVAACADKPTVVTPEPAPPPYDVRWVRSPADLESLELGGNKGAVVEVLESMSAALHGSDFALYTDPTTPPEGMPTMGGSAIVAVMRIGDGDGPSCATMTTFGGGQDGFRVSTKGVCGGISVVHSLLQLGLLPRGQAINGDKLDEGELGRRQGPVADSMTLEELARQHERGGTGPCKIFAANPGIATNAGGAPYPDILGKIRRAVREGQDCTLSVYAQGADGKPTLSHFEHITRVRRTGGTTTIETTNGLDQGTSTATVPAAPGTNTWTCTPGGNPPMSLTGSTHSDAEKYKKSIPPVQNISGVCCPKKP